ncbi:MAG TPA: hypothetical protein VLG68_06415 [Gammaproteobacteria bacterium]|nr:hypothetical protein [Gammaproteobacteria bacterium]
MVAFAALTRMIRTLLPALRTARRAYRPRPVLEAGYVTVATYDSVTAAHIALGRLEAEGIRAELFDDHMVQMDWLYAIALGGIKLKVSRGDAARAKQVLETDYSSTLDGLDVNKSNTED